MEDKFLEQLRRDQLAALVYGIGCVFIVGVVSLTITGVYLAIKHYAGW